MHACAKSSCIIPGTNPSVEHGFPFDPLIKERPQSSASHSRTSSRFLLVRPILKPNARDAPAHMNRPRIASQKKPPHLATSNSTPFSIRSVDCLVSRNKGESAAAGFRCGALPSVSRHLGPPSASLFATRGVVHHRVCIGVLRKTAKGILLCSQGGTTRRKTADGPGRANLHVADREGSRRRFEKLEKHVARGLLESANGAGGPNAPEVENSLSLSFIFRTPMRPCHAFHRGNSPREGARIAVPISNFSDPTAMIQLTIRVRQLNTHRPTTLVGINERGHFAAGPSITSSQVGPWPFR